MKNDRYINNQNLSKITIKESLNGYFSSELLAPAGSKESFYAAMNAGADAIYIGGNMFGARAFADNPDECELLELIDYAHIQDKKLFLTVNTLLKDTEIKKDLYNYILPYYKHGLDAVIVQDFGVMEFISQYFPDLPVHASTQMTSTNIYLPRLLKKNKSITRIVTARELSLKEINNIYKETGLEIEAFVHGALCYCYSGQCLFSSVAAGRSGNRGRCGQPCRLPYKVNKNTSYILSPKDLISLKNLPDILKSGVYSLKIEGRMKKPEYVASVISVYRYYLDLLNNVGASHYKVNENDIYNLMDIYNRGNFTTGYFYMHNGKDMLSTDRPNHMGIKVLKKISGPDKYKALRDINKGDIIETGDKSETVKISLKEGEVTQLHNLISINPKLKPIYPDYINRIRNNKLIDYYTDKYINHNVKAGISMEVYAHINEPLRLNISIKDTNITVYGDIVTEAVNRPVSKDDIKERFIKTGNTPFVTENININCDDNIFINLKSCNELRRKGLDELQKLIINTFSRNNQVQYLFHNDNKKTVHISNNNFNLKFNVLVSSEEQLDLLCTEEYSKYISRIYLELDFFEPEDILKIAEKCHKNHIDIYIAMAYIFRKKTSDYYLSYKNIFTSGIIDGYLIRTLEEYEFLLSEKYINTNKDIYNIVFDYNVYAYNTFSKKYLYGLKPEYLTASMELNFYELKSLSVQDSEIMIYGNFPLMISAQCVNKTMGNCIVNKKDFKDKAYTVITDRLGNTFRSLPVCRNCYSLIYNNKPLSLLGNYKEICELNPMYMRLNFTFENKDMVKHAMDDFIKVFINGGDINTTEFISNEYTKVHFHRKTE